MELKKDQKTFLLELARKAIKHFLKTGKTLQINVKDKIFKEKRGAFVTLKTNQKLRGCIGYPLPYKPLYETIIDAAIQAATQDYRFPSVTEEELPDTQIEISILSLPEDVKDITEIEIGKHGIILSKGYNKGLLLPQVPVEWNWDLETYLQHGSLKAGLDEDAWKKGAHIQKFTADVFSE